MLVQRQAILPGQGKLALRKFRGSDGVEEPPVELLCQLGCGICCLDVVLEAGPDAV